MDSVASPELEPLREFDWARDDGVCPELVRVMSELLEADVTELDPLYQIVDPDALERLFAPSANPQSRLNGSVRFEYHGYPVVISANGRGYIYERDEAS